MARGRMATHRQSGDVAGKREHDEHPAGPAPASTAPPTRRGEPWRPRRSRHLAIPSRARAAPHPSEIAPLRLPLCVGHPSQTIARATMLSSASWRGGRSLRTSSDCSDPGRDGARFARAERKRPIDASAALSGLEPKPGAGGHHRCAPRAHGRDDLLRIDPLEVDRGRAEAGMAELALDDVQRNALASELERVRVSQLMRREPAPDARLGAEAPELAADTRG
jgi:hypothetical protein